MEIENLTIINLIDKENIFYLFIWLDITNFLFNIKWNMEFENNIFITSMILIFST